MTDDLHNIDDLFRDGIEGHEEDVPPSVWEAVSHDLDKKQALYYKSKYRRTKKAAVLLLLLCFLAGMYIVYKTTGDKEAASDRKNPASATTANRRSAGEKKNDHSPVVTEGRSPDESPEAQTENRPPNDTASTSSLPQTAEQEQKQNGNSWKDAAGAMKQPLLKKSAIHAMNKSVVKKPVTAWISPLARRRKKEGPENPEQLAATKYRKEREEQTSLSNAVPTSPSSAYQPVLLPAKDYNARINITASAAKDRTILPPTASVAKKKAQTAHGFSLTAFGAPNISLERLEDNDHLAGPGRNRQEAHREEQENYSFSAGLALSYNLTDRWSLQSGLSLTSSSIGVAPKTVYVKADNNGRARYELHCSPGYVYINPKSGVTLIVGDSAQTSGTVSRLTYITVPASASYRFSKGRFSLSPSIGAGLNFLVSGKATTSLSNRAGSESTTTSITGLKPTYVDGYFGLGLDYNLNKKLSIGIRPNARLALTPINKETPVQSYQNFLSIETGVRIKL